MTSLDIKISISKIKDYSVSSLSKKEEKTLLMLIESFSMYVMNLYGILIEEAVNSNRYRGQWEPMEEKGYKEYLGTEPTGDILLYLKKSLEVKKIGRNFIIRVNPKIKYPGSDLSIEKVILAIDNGTSKFNARPVCKRIVSQIRAHILDLWRGFLLMKGVI